MTIVVDQLPSVHSMPNDSIEVKNCDGKTIVSTIYEFGHAIQLV